MASPTTQGTFSIVGIDNDQAFVFPLKKPKQLKDPYKLDLYYLQLKTILFLMPEMEKSPHQGFIDTFLKLNPERLFIDWLSALKQKNNEYQNLQDVLVFSPKNLKELSLPLMLYPKVVVQMYQTLSTLQSLLQNQQFSSHRDILLHLFPNVYEVYQSLLQTSENNPLEAQKKLFANPTFIIQPQSINTPSEDGDDPPEATTISTCAETFLIKVFPSLTQKRQKNFLNQTLLAFPECRSLQLKNCQLEDESFYRTISSSKSIDSLTLDGWTRLTLPGLYRILNDFPDLKVYLTPDLSFSPEQFTALMTFAIDHERFLFFLIGDDSFLIQKENIQKIFEASLEGSHILIAKALLSLGADLNQKDEKGNTLLHRFAQKDPKIISFLLEQGLSPCEKNKRGYTLLHLAAQGNFPASIELLIKKGALLEEKDLDGKTPLHLAVIAGKIENTETLIEQKADLQAVSSQKETIFHFAVSHCHLSLIKYFLSFFQNSLKNKEDTIQTDQKPRKCGCRLNVNFYHLLEQKNDDGKTPLHLAMWGDPRPEIVALLLEQGVDVNATNNYGYTPLHWAAKHGHLESAKLLIEKKARLDIVNSNEDTPIDLALRWGQDSLVRFLIDPENFKEIQDPAPGNIQDICGYYFQQFKTKYEEGNALDQVFYLEKLGDYYLSKNDYTRAAHLINSVLHIAIRYRFSENHHKLLFAKLERIEGFFLEKLGKKTPVSYKGKIKLYRQFLQEARLEAESQLKANDPIEQIQEKLTENFQKLLTMLIKDSIFLLQEEPPTKFAVIGLGSMSRKEMCPYSDIEFAFLIEKDTPENRDYFRKLSQLIEIKSINLGETKFPIIPSRKIGNQMLKEESLIPNGFSMDIGGLSPRGKEGVYELIGSPKSFAAFQNPEWFEKNEAEIILVNSLTNYFLVTGEKKLVEKYKKEILKILNKKGISKEKIRQERALALLKGHLEEFKPYLEETRIDLRAFNIKKDFYRPVQMIVGGLGLFYGTKDQNTLSIVKELETLKVFSVENSRKLQDTLKKALVWRVKTHLHYKNEIEIVHFPREEEIDTGLYLINQEDTQSMLEMYRVLFPLQEAVKDFIKGNRRIFTQNILYDEKIGKYNSNIPELKNISDACIRALAIDPNNLQALNDLQQIKLSLGAAEEALKYNQERLAILQRQKPLPLLDISKTLGNIGVCYANLGDYQESVRYLQQAHEMKK